MSMLPKWTEVAVVTKMTRTKISEALRETITMKEITTTDEGFTVFPGTRQSTRLVCEYLTTAFNRNCNIKFVTIYAFF